MTNAIKHSPDNSEIELLANEKGIYIKDKGAGIDPNIINNLGKENIIKNDNLEGSGMGLVFVNILLKGTKLKLHFENIPGGGTLAGLVLV